MDDDSFFGFDTSIPLDDDGGGGPIEEPSEEEYDALNDETFGSAINGDWEEAHENLVRLSDTMNNRSESEIYNNRRPANDRDRLKSSPSSRGSTPNFYNSRRADLIADSDLELNLSGMKLDDVDINFDDDESLSGDFGSGIHLDPSVWATQPIKPTNQTIPLDRNKTNNSIYSNFNNSEGKIINLNPADFLRQHLSSPFSQNHQQQQDEEQQQQQQKQEQLQQHQKKQLQQLKEQQELQHQLQQYQQQTKGNNTSNSAFGLHQLPQSGNKPKICTLEDIERNIMKQTLQKQQQQQQQQDEQQQQKQHKEQEQQKQQQSQNLNDIFRQMPMKPLTPVAQMQQQQQPSQVVHGQQQQQQSQSQNHTQQQQPQTLQNQQHQLQAKGPPGFSSSNSPPRPPNLINNLPPPPPHPMNNMLHQPHIGNRMPPGFPLHPPGMMPHMQPQGHPHMHPHPLLNQHGPPPNFMHQHPLPNQHLPIALNNFALHPNFNAMRATSLAGMYPAGLIPPPVPHIPPHPNNHLPLLNQQQSNSFFNMYNMRLVHEMQQNHPFLHNPSQPMLNPQLQQQLAQQHSSGNNNQAQQVQRSGTKQNQRSNANGNLPDEEFDEYANLMSTRDKHWLIGIQLSQLNTDTPYIDDYYYTVYRERKSVLSGNVRHSQAHKDNQLNHPLTQPKGHAQLVLVQLGNKNGTRNGQHRERLNSETSGANSSIQDLKTPYVYTPLKFENSLGKLQYGSVTAPRKIIDADIMSHELAYINASLKTSKKGKTSSKPSTIRDVAISIQRRSRQILLHIETLYHIILKLDDLENPNAIATIIIKKQKESERIAALEQMEYANKTPEERAAEAANPQSVNPALKNKFAYEIETKDALLEKLIAGLAQDKVYSIVPIRKGKSLIRRSMAYITDSTVLWNIWIGVFSSLQNIYRKDRTDSEGLLYALYPEFKKQLSHANFETIVQIANAIPLKEQKIYAIYCSRFGISSLVSLIIQAEQIYVSGSDATLNDENKVKWRTFLDNVATSLNFTLESQTLNAAIELYSIQPMKDHFARFKDLKLDSLLALITEAQQQIN